jgi:hypothetical protein
VLAHYPRVLTKNFGFIKISSWFKNRIKEVEKNERKFDKEARYKK